MALRTTHSSATTTKTATKIQVSSRTILTSKILQMSTAELNDHIKQLSETVILEELTEPTITKDDICEPKDSQQTKEEDPYDSRNETTEELGENLLFGSSEEFDDHGSDSDRTGSDISSHFSDDTEYSADWIQDESDNTLRAKLELHLNEECDDENVKIIGKWMIGFVNLGTGFIAESDEELAKLFESEYAEEISLSLLRQARVLISQFEGRGIGTCSFAEYYIFALQSDFQESKVIANLLHKNDINTVATLIKQQNVQQLSKIGQTETKKIVSLIKKIQRLTPTPLHGLAFRNIDAEYCIPEILVSYDVNRDNKKDDDDEKQPFQLEYLKNALYRMEVAHNLYKNWIKELSGKDRAKIKNDYAQAENLEFALQERESNLLKVCRIVFSVQQQYLMTGKRKDLKTLTQSDIEQQTGINSGTISRIVRNKYIVISAATEETVLLSSLLIKETKHRDGYYIPQQQTKDIIRELVNKEDKMHPLSDQKIADILQADYPDFEVALRTVTKYRKQLGIPNTRERKIR